MINKLNPFKATIAALFLAEGMSDTGCENLNKIQATALELGATGFDKEEGACYLEIKGPENAQQFIDYLDGEDCVEAYDVTMDGDGVADDVNILDLPEETVFGFAIYLAGDEVTYESADFDEDDMDGEEEDEDEDLEEGLLAKLEKLAGGEFKPGRVTIGGFPIDIHDGNPEEGLEADAVDADAAKGFAALARKAGIKVKRVGSAGLLLMEGVGPSLVDEHGAVVTLEEARKRIQVNFTGKKRVKMQCAKGFKYDAESKTCVKIAGDELATRRKASIKALVSRKAGGAALKNRAAIRTKKAMKFRASMGLK